jgi:exonuclease III
MVVNGMCYTGTSDELMQQIKKWIVVRRKIKETNCDIICIQETKREWFDQAYLRNFCPSHFDCFEYNPSIGLSGGTIIIWKSAKFSCPVVFQNEYAMSVEFISIISDNTWTLTHIYAPCTSEGNQQFFVLVS